MVDIPLVKIDDIVEMKRPHPCTARSRLFKVVRIGADIKMQCLGCGTVIMLTRDLFNHRIKRIAPPEAKLP